MRSHNLLPIWIVTCLVVLASTSSRAQAAPRLPLSAAPASPTGAAFEELKKQAEQLYAEHSYAKAHDLYQQAKTLELKASDARWVDFRIADSAWRSQAGTQTSDSTVFDKAREQLEELVKQIKRAEDRDLVWAQANESLGDFWWARQGSQNWGQGWPFYQQALDWWAGSGDLDAAREHYLRIVRTMAQPSWMERGSNGYYANVPLEILDNALKIALNDNDKAHAHYLIAMTLRNQGDWRQQLRVQKEFEGAIVAGKTADWYDDALYAYGEWLANNGPLVIAENGQFTRQPDYDSALALFQRLVREFRKGETRYWDNAQNFIKQITDPALSVSVSNIFMPGSEVQYHLAWRNIKQIELSLYRIDLTKDLKIITSQNGLENWVDRIDIGSLEKTRSWTKDTNDKEDHRPGQSSDRLETPLPMGAYLLVAASQGGGVKARDVIYVTDAAVVLKTAGDQALTFVCDALNSAPMANAKVRLWKLVYSDNKWLVADATKQTDEQGLCVFGKADFPGLPPGPNGQTQYFATAIKEDRQAIAFSGANRFARNLDQWRIYAFTDRPAYRPKETVQWKLIARTTSSTGFVTPADQAIEYQIDDPRGSKITEGTAQLNAFGSAWGSLNLTESMPLGEYRVTYWKDRKHEQGIGSATLFRLEEYKLPEFQVAVKIPEENGKKKAFVLGDYVEADIQADYYFGGPVANATVEVVVHQNPYYHWWIPKHEFPWAYDQENPYRYWGGGEGQIIKRETLKTDQTGKAVLTFETPANSGQDFEYRIEARVIDASRREITASDTVRVTRQRYYVHPTPKHNLYQPNDKIEIDLKAIDANDQPVQTEGKVHVTRERWIEIWLDPAGQEVKGAALREIQARERIFPPPLPNPDAHPWRLKFQGYESEDILSTTVKLDAKGEGTFTFTPSSEGYYHIAWLSMDQALEGPRTPITADAYVWVATNSTSELGYRHGGLEIIIDKDTFRVGQTAPVMINVPTNDRYVLFSVEGNDLYSYQVVHVTGTVKLVQVPIDQRHVPNIYLDAIMAHDGQLFEDRKEVIVPPVEQYLNIEVASDRQGAPYQPGEEGKFTVTTKDHDGKPISAEVALAVVDEAVTYIQQDYAGDPRPFFFEQRQALYVQGGSTFQQKPYVKLIKGEKDQLIDARFAAANERDEEFGGNRRDLKDRSRMAYAGRDGGGGGGSGGGGMRDAAEMATGGVVADSMMGLTNRFAAQSPAAPGKPMLMSKAEMKSGGKELGQVPGPDQLPAVQVRSDFRSTLLWQPSIITDEDGTAKVSLKYADSLTTWKATARAAGKGNQFGIGSTTTRTKMPLIARLQAPRFFLVGDTVTISGVINNNTDQVQTVTPELDAQGLTIFAMLKDGQPMKGIGTLDIPANGESRVDWQVNVEKAGEAHLKLTARSDKYADAMEKSYTVYEHGIERFIAKSGKVRGNDVTIKLDIPSERKVESTTLMVQISPSMAVTMLDALPYLIDYPYGCTEQTMSRFLPAAITAKTLKDLGIKPEVAMSKVFGGIEQATADKTHPKGKKDLAKLDEITKASLERLYGFQHGDGGWGWWKEGDSDHYMTAYVLWGLCLAKDAGLEVKQDAIERAATYLDKEIVEEEAKFDEQAWLLHALASYHATMRHGQVGEFQAKALENLWTNRDKLNAYTRALLALSAHALGDAVKAKTLVENLENGVKRDERPDASVIVKGVQGPNDAVIGTAHWGEDGIYWRWSDGGVESTAFALRAILAIDPKNKLVEPVSNWLIKNRRGAQWNSTRDTAITVLAMNDYLRASGELTPELEYELQVNGKSIITKKLSAEDVLGAPSRIAIDRQLIRDGSNDIRIIRKGTSNTGSLYFAAEATFFSLEEPVPPSGNEIFVRRDYYKLVPKPTLLKGYVYDRVPIADGGSVASGERVEVIMTVEAKNNYEYLIFEDLKPAGLDAVEVRSGESVFAKEMKARAINRTFGAGGKAASAVQTLQANGDPDDYTGRTRWVYQELRDRKVALFIDHLPEGVWEIRYDLRAETPGRFHALPVMGSAMYVPEIRANSGELRLSVSEATK